MGNSPETPKPTAQESAAGTIAVNQWNEYATKWQQPIQRWASSIDREKSPEMARATGMTNADLAQRSAGMERTLAASGFNPNSGKMIATLGSATNTAGTVGGGAAIQARQGVADARLQGLQQVANIGMGQKTDAVTGLNQIAQQSVSSALNSAANGQANRFARNNMLGGMAGVAAGVGMEASRPQAAGALADYSPAAQQAIWDGASSGQNGYTVRNGGMYWNNS